MLPSNMFGDILSNEASMPAGPLGVLPSASLGNGVFGLYEPAHGSAPDIADLRTADPLGTILSTSMLLRHSLALDEEATAVERAVDQVLEAGYRTADLNDSARKTVGIAEIGDRVAAALETP